MAGSPFKFLDSFTKEDKEIFFGRDKEIEEIYSRVFQSNLLLLYGASGTGKTSLIQCGLANKFNDSDWMPILIRRGGNILESIRSQIKSLAITSVKEEASLKKTIQSLYLDHFKPVYLIFDQFEELFIFGTPEETAELVKEVAGIIKTDLQCKFIFVIRGEYLEHLSAFEEKLPEFFSNRIRIEKMTRIHAAEAIIGPCRQAQITVETGFEQGFLELLSPGKAEVELTYLQVFLDKLYKKAIKKSPSHPVFNQSLLNEAGQISDVLSDFLEEQIALIPDSETALAVLKSFVSVEGTKRQIDTAEIGKFARSLGKEIKPDQIDKLVHQFVDLRILRDKDESGKYELRHDSLAVKIYEKITLAEKDLIEVRNLIENAYSNYLKRNILIHESDLAYILPYERNLFLTEHLHTFLEDSKKASTQTRRRRRLALLITACLVFAILSGFSIWALSERGRAMEQSQEAEKQKLLADQQKNEALNAKDEAMKAKDLVMQEKQLAEKNEKSAMNAMHQADQAKQQAMTAMAVAEKEKSNAMQQSVIAKNEAINAENQKEIAKSEKSKAEESEKKARKSYLLSLAQGTALKAPMYKNDIRLQALLAYQAFRMNKENGGTERDPVIFDALRAALNAPSSQKANPSMGLIETKEYIALKEQNDTLVFAMRSGYIYATTPKNSKAFYYALVRSYPYATDRIFFNPNGHEMITSHENYSLCLWPSPGVSLLNPPVHEELTGHRNLVRTLVFNKASDLFVSGGKDSIIILWDLKNGKAQPRKTITAPAGVKNLVFSKNEQALYCLLENGTIKILDLQHYKLESFLFTGKSKPVCMAINVHSNKLVLGLSNGNIWSEDLGTHTHSEIISHLTGIDLLVFNTDNTLLASAGSDRTLKLYDCNNMDASPLTVKDLHAKIRVMTFTAGNKLLVSCSDINTYLIETSCEKMADVIYASLKRNMNNEEWSRFFKDIPYEKTRTDLP
ncbi:MAG: hypothetical protein ACHQRM_03420 [Bacteroidia bacterium]